MNTDIELELLSNENDSKY